jgi:hypothetical protein
MTKVATNPSLYVRHTQGTSPHVHAAHIIASSTPTICLAASSTLPCTTPPPATVNRTLHRLCCSLQETPPHARYTGCAAACRKQHHMHATQAVLQLARNNTTCTLHRLCCSLRETTPHARYTGCAAPCTEQHYMHATQAVLQLARNNTTCTPHRLCCSL